MPGESGIRARLEGKGRMVKEEMYMLSGLEWGGGVYMDLLVRGASWGP